MFRHLIYLIIRYGGLKKHYTRQCNVSFIRFNKRASVGTYVTKCVSNVKLF